MRLEPDSPKYHLNLALALLDQGEKGEAEAEHKKGVELAPKDWPETVLHQAWEKATAADPKQRSPQQAIFLARQACQNDDQRPEAWDALAAAYAAAGRFKEAMRQRRLRSAARNECQRETSGRGSLCTRSKSRTFRGKSLFLKGGGGRETPPLRRIPR